ncbi:phage minor head protein [Fibrella sp. WM1]|uniref:phage head morphogenesis protein n=1 Tax=Fibrella musci TaxID=3242485 RepID=UPI003522A43D
MGHHLHLAAGENELPRFLNIKKLVRAALKNLFDGFEGLVEPNLFRLTFDALDHAITAGFGKVKTGDPNWDFVQQLRKSAAWFAARKTYRQRIDLAALLADDKGKLRTWKQFQEAAQPVAGAYNQTWLQVEYNTAVNSAYNASRWKAFEAEVDVYPNLIYTPSRAATPRDEHKPFYHVVRPVDDDFWVHHFPPSEYNCMCGVEQTDDEVTDVPGKAPKAAPGLDHNVGKTGELFSKTHPYSDSLTDKERKAIDEEGEKLMDDEQ